MVEMVSSSGQKQKSCETITMRRVKLLVAGLSMLLCETRGVFANRGISVGVSADYVSKYIWRGQKINNGSVFQPAILMSAYGFTGSIWGNLDLTNKNDNKGEFSEFDYTLDYTSVLPGVEGMKFSLGTIYYRFPHTSYNPTTEVYASLSLAMPLSPSIRVYRDIDEIDGSYLLLGLGHIFEKLVMWSDDCYCGLRLGASAGWGNSIYNNSYFGINHSEFNDLTLSAGLTVCMKLWTIRPSINYSTILGDKIRSATVSSDNLWVGISISRSL